jgi:hypothetical protein
LLVPRGFFKQHTFLLLSPREAREQSNNFHTIKRFTPFRKKRHFQAGLKMAGRKGAHYDRQGGLCGEPPGSSARCNNQSPLLSLFIPPTIPAFFPSKRGFYQLTTFIKL